MPYLGVRPADITSATEAEIAGDLTVDTNTLKVDSSNNRVGVGVVAPDVHLHVQNDTNPRFRVEDTTNNVKFDVLAQNSDVKMGNNSNHDLRIITNNSERLRVLAAGGLTFNGDTAALNALDDYEEGDWTPTGNGQTLTNNFAKYRKIGTLVGIQAYIVFPTNSDTSGNANITGLPYAGTQPSNSYGAFSVGYSDKGSSFTILKDQTTTSLDLRLHDGNNVKNADMSGKTLIFSGIYISV